MLNRPVFRHKPPNGHDKLFCIYSIKRSIFLPDCRLPGIILPLKDINLPYFQLLCKIFARYNYFNRQHVGFFRKKCRIFYRLTKGFLSFIQNSMN